MSDSKAPIRRKKGKRRRDSGSGSSSDDEEIQPSTEPSKIQKDLNPEREKAKVELARLGSEKISAEKASKAAGAKVMAKGGRTDANRENYKQLKRVSQEARTKWEGARAEYQKFRTSAEVEKQGKNASSQARRSMRNSLAEMEKIRAVNESIVTGCTGDIDQQSGVMGWEEFLRMDRKALELLDPSLLSMILVVTEGVKPDHKLTPIHHGRVQDANPRLLEIDSIIPGMRCVRRGKGKPLPNEVKALTLGVASTPGDPESQLPKAFSVKIDGEGSYGEVWPSNTKETRSSILALQRKNPLSKQLGSTVLANLGMGQCKTDMTWSIYPAMAHEVSESRRDNGKDPAESVQDGESGWIPHKYPTAKLRKTDNQPFVHAVSKYMEVECTESCTPSEAMSALIKARIESLKAENDSLDKSSFGKYSVAAMSEEVTLVPSLASTSTANQTAVADRQSKDDPRMRIDSLIDNTKKSDLEMTGM